MEGMRRGRVLVVLALLTSGLASPRARAQAPQAPLPSEPEEEAKPYTPPAAWRSVEIGDYYFKRKKYNAALSRYEEAATTDPHYPRAYLGLGKAYERIGLKQKALESYQRYLDELPSTKDALEAKDAHKAVARLEKQLKSHPPSRPKAGVARAPPASH